MTQAVRFKVTGNGSILMHNPASMRRAPDTPQRGGKRIPTPIEESTAALFALPSGQLFIRSECFREASLEASKDIRDPTRKGRTNMMRRYSGSVFLASEFCPLFRSDGTTKITSDPDDWEIDTRRVIVQRQGILRSRPKITDWSCFVEFEYDEDTIDPNLILVILELAGKYPGVLDYRVGKKGTFGRFTAEMAGPAEPERQTRSKKTKQKEFA